MAGLHKQVSHIKNLPIPEEALSIKNSDLRDLLIVYNIKKAWDEGNEIYTQFTKPWILQVAESMLPIEPQGIEINRKEFLFDDEQQDNLSLIDIENKTIREILDYLLRIEDRINLHLHKLQERIDQAVFAIFHISEIDRKFIEKEQSNRPNLVVWPEMEGKSIADKRREHVRRLVSTFLRQALQDDADGLLPLTPVPGEIDRARCPACPAGDCLWRAARLHLGRRNLG